MTMADGLIAPSLNLERPDPIAADLDLVTELRRSDLEVLLSNSFGFGGTNACLVVARGPEAHTLTNRGRRS